MAWVWGVLDDAACLPQALFRVYVLDEWKHGPSNILGCLYHSLEGLVVMQGAIPIKGCDATCEDALDGATVVFGEDPGGKSNFFRRFRN